MNFTQEIIVENAGTDYKNVERARLRVKFYMDGVIIGDRDGIVVLSGPKNYIELVANGDLTITGYNKLLDNK